MAVIYNLFVYATENAVACVRLLLETTPSIMNWQDFEGRTPLHLAVEIGNDYVVALLVCVILLVCAIIYK